IRDATVTGVQTCALPISKMISTGSTTGIQGHISSLGHEPHNYVTVYVQVDDLRAYLDKAGKLGGKTLVPPTEVPGMGKFAWLARSEERRVGKELKVVRRE